MAHVYFASYARLDDTVFAKVSEVAEDLCSRVRTKLGANQHDPIGFIDSSAILTGEQWEERLSVDAHSARVLVCFMSATYFNSEWCAKEFAIFRKRVGAIHPPPPVLIPVLWERGATLPQALSQIQFRDGRLPDKYVSDGLAALRRVKSAGTAYSITLNVLAEIIIDAAQYDLPPLYPRVPFGNLPSAFDNPEGDGIMLAVIHPKGTQWQLGLPGSTVARHVDETAHRLKLPWREIVADGSMVDNIVTLASSGKTVVVVTDESSADLALQRQQLAAIDKHVAGAIGVLFGTSAATADLSPIRGLLPNVSASSIHHVQAFTLGSKKSLMDKLESVVCGLRPLKIGQQGLVKATDPLLSEAAAREGIPVTTRPTLQGPGATP